MVDSLAAWSRARLHRHPRPSLRGMLARLSARPRAAQLPSSPTRHELRPAALTEGGPLASGERPGPPVPGCTGRSTWSLATDVSPAGGRPLAYFTAK